MSKATKTKAYCYVEVRNYGKILFIQSVVENGWWGGIRVSLFPGFSTSRKTKNLLEKPGIPGNFRDPENPRDSRDLGNFEHFDIFHDFQHFRLVFSILLRCFDKLSTSFSIFSTN